MAFQDLREFLAYLEGVPGEIVRFSEPLDPRYEVAAVLGYHKKGGPAVVVEEVRGYPGWQVVGNVLGTKRRVALALGVPEEEVSTEYFRRKSAGLPPVEVEQAPVKEVVKREEIDLTKTLPVLTYHEGDVGPYITAGICIARDRATGRYHLGIHRLQVKGPNRLGILLANPPLSTYFAAAEARGEALEVAVAVGVDPLLMLAAVSRAGHGPDKLAIAGALRGEPVPLVRAETLDLLVPATAEVVIEGRILPGVRELEGPFGESTGYYFAFNNPVIEVTAITHRSRPLYQAIVPAGAEGETILSLCSASEICHYLAELVEGFRGFAFLAGTYCFHGVLSLKKKNKAEARRAALLALSLDPRLKQVVVVDDDVDINSYEDVAWAVATRCRAEEDIIVVPRLPSYVIDPAAVDGAADKVIIDATKPPAEEGRFARIRTAAAAMAKAQSLWNGCGIKGGS